MVYGWIYIICNDILTSVKNIFGNGYVIGWKTLIEKTKSRARFNIVQNPRGL